MYTALSHVLRYLVFLTKSDDRILAHIVTELKRMETHKEYSDTPECNYFVLEIFQRGPKK